MRRTILTCGVLAMLAPTMAALTLRVTPGTMADNLSDLRNTTDTELKLTGSANVTDLVLLRDMSRAVRKLDMSGLRIVAYTYAEGDYAGRKSFHADEIPPYMLMSSSVTEFVFPTSVQTIGTSAFASSALTSVAVPSSVTTIDSNAFANCPNLSTATVSGPVTLGNSVFKDCKSLRGVNFGYGITKFPEAMFDGCMSYTASLPESVTTVGDYAMRGTALESLDLRNVTVVGAFAFADMPRLTEITVCTDDHMDVGRGAFFNNPALETLPNWDGVLSDIVLANTRGAGSLTVSYEVIPEGAYANNSAVTELKLTETVRELKSHAFRNMTSLNQVDVTKLGKNMPEIAADSFSGLENSEGRYDVTLNVEKGTNGTWEEHPVWGLFQIRNMDSGIVDTVTGSADIRVRRSGDAVTISSTDPIEFAGVYTVGGVTLHESRPMSESCVIDDIDPSAIVIVKIESAGTAKVVKLN